MAEYIEKSKAQSIVTSVMKDYDCADDYGFDKISDALVTIWDKLQALNPADICPEKHGVWVRVSDDDQDEGWFICSECKEEYFNPSDDNDLLPSFCPNCGTKMDGKDRKRDG